MTKFDHENIFVTYQKLSGQLIEVSKYMDRCTLKDIENFREETVFNVKEAYILINECVRQLGLNTTKHIWSAVEAEQTVIVEEIDEDDI